MLMGSVWFIPDASEWRRENDYNLRVAAALECAYERLRPDGHITGEVLACLAPVLDAPMCKSQRLRVLYVVASCRAAEDPPTPALEPIDDALELALELKELRAQVDLLLLRAAINRCISQTPDAADDLRDCLQALVTLNLRDDWSEDELLLTLKATVRLAAQEFLLGAYDECQGWLDHAATLLPRVGVVPDLLARYAWIRAQLFRWRADYAEALTAAATAVGHYRTLHDPQNLSRIEAIAGDILLDLAERSRRTGDDTACATYLTQAEPYIERALQIAVANDFQASEAGARIVRARLQLLQGLPGDRKILLEELANKAWQHQDMDTVCAAYTGMGRECEAVHDDTSAKEWYRRAITVVNESQAIADAVWAQRALWRLEGEMAVEK
jgi:tetratricopeptide (TPR) repeat protein